MEDVLKNKIVWTISDIGWRFCDYTNHISELRALAPNRHRKINVHIPESVDANFHWSAHYLAVCLRDDDDFYLETALVYLEKAMELMKQTRGCLV